MAEYSCLEITNTGKILSISTPEPNLLYELLPSNTENLLQCWDEETNRDLKHWVTLVFSSAFPSDFSLTINGNKLQLLGHRLSDDMAFIYVKSPEENKILSEKEWLALVDFSYQNAEACIFFVREDATFYEFNETAILLHGYSREEMLTMNVFDLNPFFTKDMWHEGWKRLIEKGTSTVEARHKKRMGPL